MRLSGAGPVWKLVGVALLALSLPSQAAEPEVKRNFGERITLEDSSVYSVAIRYSVTRRSRRYSVSSRGPDGRPFSALVTETDTARGEIVAKYSDGHGDITVTVLLGFATDHSQPVPVTIHIGDKDHRWLAPLITPSSLDEAGRDLKKTLGTLAADTLRNLQFLAIIGTDPKVLAQMQTPVVFEILAPLLPTGVPQSAVESLAKLSPKEQDELLEGK